MVGEAWAYVQESLRLQRLLRTLPSVGFLNSPTAKAGGLGLSLFWGACLMRLLRFALLPFAALLLFPFAPPVLADGGKPALFPPMAHGGLTCFTILPPATKAPLLPPSCNALCAKEDAVCSGVASPLNPPATCEDSAFAKACRCCKVGGVK